MKKTPSINSVSDVIALVCWAAFFVFIGAYFVPHHDNAMVDAKNRHQNNAVHNEQNYERWFWKQKMDNPKLYHTIIARVQSSDGKIVSGSLVFTPDCPIGYDCAQPDQSFTDHDDLPYQTEDRNEEDARGPQTSGE